MFLLLLGHYVVVCGYDLKKKKIFYKNPSYDEGKHYTYVKTIKFFLSPPPKFQSTVDCYPKDVIHSSYIMCKLKYMLYRCISKHIKTYLSSLAVMELYGSWNLLNRQSEGKPTFFWHDWWNLVVLHGSTSPNSLNLMFTMIK